MASQEEVRLQEAKSSRMRERICRAVAECLVRDGYADTSISRVAAHAGVSKGALQHHFPAKEDMMAATAEWLLGNARFIHLHNTRGPRAERSTERELLRTWEKGANTAEFRALLEILVKMRTDGQLRSRLGPLLRDWQEQIVQLTRAGYEATSGDDDDVAILMAMNVCMIRGLVIQQQYSDDRAFIERIMRRWIGLVSPLLKPRSGAPGGGERT